MGNTPRFPISNIDYFFVVADESQDLSEASRRSEESYDKITCITDWKGEDRLAAILYN